MLEYTLSLARDLAYIWPRGPHQYYPCNSSIRLCPLCFQLLYELSDNLAFNRSSTAQLTAVRVPLCFSRCCIYLRCHRLKIFHSTITTMVPREFSKAFDFNNLYTHDKEE